MRDDAGFPPQHQQEQPGERQPMHPKPKTVNPEYSPGGKLCARRVLTTGGDSGIGRAVALLFAHEGADVAFTYLREEKDATETRGLIEQYDRRCITLSGDVGDERFCREAVQEVSGQFGGLDILVNNAGEQHAYHSLEKMSSEQMERTSRSAGRRTRHPLRLVPEGAHGGCCR